MNKLSSLFSSVFSPSPAPEGGKSGNERISHARAMEIMASAESFTVLDVRRPGEFASGHIPGAINIPNESIGSSAPAELPDKNALILLHCLSGVRSRQAAAKLAALGYTNIKDFGGIHGWPGELQQ